MENIIYVKKYLSEKEHGDLYKVNEREVWRYAGFSGLPGEEDEELKKLLQEIYKETQQCFSYKVCYRRMSISWSEGLPELPIYSGSKDVAKCIKGADEIILFAATIGMEIDRHIAKYGRLHPAKGLLLQAYGAERIETLCDYFCKEMKNQLIASGMTITNRFSPGYGDLPLETQQEVFRLLECSRKIGISLGSNMLMTPSKSVTALFGIKSCEDFKELHDENHKCSECKNIECEYRMEY